MYPSFARLGASRPPQHVQVQTTCRSRVGEPHRTAVWPKDGVRILESVNFGKKITGGSKLFGRNITQALTNKGDLQIPVPLIKKRLEVCSRASTLLAQPFASGCKRLSKEQVSARGSLPATKARVDAGPTPTNGSRNAVRRPAPQLGCTSNSRRWPSLAQQARFFGSFLMIRSACQTTNCASFACTCKRT